MIKKYFDYDMSGSNTFRMKVSCSCFVEYDTEMDLEELEFSSLPQPVIHIGSGSNLLFTGDFKGTVLHSGIKFCHIVAVSEEDALVEVGASVLFDDFCSWASDNQLWGPENLSGIPGEVGASAVQNIGAYGVEVADIISQVKCFDMVTGEAATFSKSECAFAYRDSYFKKKEVKGRYSVLSVLFHLSKLPAPRLEYAALADAFSDRSELYPADIRQSVLHIRGNKLPDPAVLGSAGSFFKNPVVSQADFERLSAIAAAQYGDSFTVPHFMLEDGSVKVPAAWLIDSCGLKGFRQGGAAVYDKQPLVLVNMTGDATPQDIIALENTVKDTVRDRYGIELHPEVEHI